MLGQSSAFGGPSWQISNYFGSCTFIETFYNNQTQKFRREKGFAGLEVQARVEAIQRLEASKPSVEKRQTFFGFPPLPPGVV